MSYTSLIHIFIFTCAELFNHVQNYISSLIFSKYFLDTIQDLMTVPVIQVPYMQCNRDCNHDRLPCIT